MSASSTPTVKPLMARPAARLTDIDDLPTPPLPDETASTLALGGTAVFGAPSRAFQRARAITAAFCSRSISLVSTLTAATPGKRADAPGHFCLDLAPERARGCREGDADHDDPVRLQLDAVDHPELDDVVAKLRIDYAPQRIAHCRLGELGKRFHDIMVRPFGTRRTPHRCPIAREPVTWSVTQSLQGGLVSTTSTEGSVGTLALSDAAAAKVIELLEEEGNPDCSFGWPSDRVAARASPTRCSSTPSLPKTTSSPVQAGSRSSSTRPARR